MRHARYAWLMFGCTVACSASPGEAPPAPNAASPSAPEGATHAPATARLTRSIPPNGLSWIELQATPGALCTWDARPDSAPTGASDAPGGGLELHADDQGFVHFRVEATDGRATSAPMHLACTDAAGAATEYDVDVIVDADAVAVRAPAARAGRVRPGFSGDPMSLSQEDIVSRGYPPRPDPVASPARYAAWLDVVSRPVNLIEPQLVQSTRAHTPPRVAAPKRHVAVNPTQTTSTSWSGFVIDNPDVQFDEIYAAWSLPSTTSESGFWTTARSSDWVGLGGWPGGEPGSIVQAGTEEDTSTRFWVASSSNYAFYEWFAGPMVTISNFPIYPGDQITTWVWTTDAAGRLNWCGGYAKFMIYDSTQGNLTDIPPYPRPYQAPYCTGNTAEWIVERTLDNGSPGDLTDYDFLVMTDAWAEDSSGASHDYVTDGSLTDQVWMTSSSNPNSYLSIPIPWGRGQIAFEWEGFN
jgi:hypothetical protein